MISRTAATSDLPGPARRAGALSGMAKGFEKLLKTDAPVRRRADIAIEPIPPDAARTPPACAGACVPVPPRSEEAWITRADLTGLAAVERVIDVSRTLRKDLCVSIDTGAGTVAVRVVPDGGALRVEVSPDPRVPQAMRLAIVDAIRRKVPGAAVRDHGGRPR